MIVPLGAIWIRFDHPAWLWAGFACLLPVILAWRYRRRGGAKPRFRVLFQTLALLLASISLACPVASFALRQAHWLILRDVSASVGEQAMGELPSPSGAAFESHDFEGTLLSRDEPARGDATHIAPALDWSTAMIQAGQADGVILLTDGQFQDDGQAVGRRFAQTHAPLWIVPLDAPPADARVATFTARPRTDTGTDRAEYDLAATLQSNTPMRRTLTLYRIEPGNQRQPLAKSEISLEPDLPMTVHWKDSSPAAAAGVWRAELSPSDALPQNDTLQSASPPRDIRVAWVATASRSANIAPGVNVVSLSPAEAPEELTGWLAYSAVVLADATGKLLSLPQRTALADYVRSGGGLVLIGAGPHDTPADRDDPLHRILPLRANPFERSPLNLTVILDASGSMAQPLDVPTQTKWSLVSEAVLSLREHLTPADRLCVIVFSDDARTIYDSGVTAPDFSSLAEALHTLSPAGPTNIAPALERSLGVPPVEQSDGARTNLVLVLSDLQAAPFDSSAFAKRFEEQGCKLAVVATGSPDAGNTSLGQLADQLHAPVIFREHLQGLADVFGRLCRQGRGEAVRRGEFTIQYEESSWYKTVTVRRIDAYIPAAVVGDAPVVARIFSTGDPLLADWRVGLGRSAVISAPPEAFLPLPGSERLIAAWVRQVSRSSGDPHFDTQITREAERVVFRVAARDGDTPIDNLALQAEVLDLADVLAEPILIPCLQSAPGEYQAALPLAAGYQALAVRILAEQGRIVWQGVAPLGYPAEYARLGADYDSLRRLAAVAGGRIVTPAELASPAMQAELRQPRSTGESVAWIPLAGATVFTLLGWLGGTWRMRRGQRQ